MNMTIHSNGTESKTVLSLIKATDLIIAYGIPGVSGIGILFNIATIIVLTNRRKFQNNFYDLLRCRSFCSLVVCCFGIFYRKTTCGGCRYNYIYLFLNWYVLHLPIRVAFLASFISDNLIVLNRLANIYNKTSSLFFKLTKKVTLLICYSGPILLVLPIYFGVEIVKLSDSPSETQAYWTLNAFGNKIIKSYALFTLVFELVIPLIMLITLNIMTALAFKKVMKSKVEVVGRSSATKRAEKAMIRFTRLIIALTTINIVTRTLDSSMAVFTRVETFFGPDRTAEMDAVLDLLRYASFIPFFGAHALDGLLYYVYDKNMSGIFRKSATRAVSTRSKSFL